MMAKRTIKNLGRRGLALFLSLVMMTSLMQVTAFAAQYKDQTMEGYYTVASDGTVGTTDATYVEQDGFTLKKEITQTGKDAFDITLTVQTSQTVSKTYDRSATVLVLDMSNSMDYNFGDQTTRLNEAEKVAKEFLASYAGTDADAEQYLSIVWFGTSSGVDQAWVNVAGGAGQNSYDTVYNYLDALDEAPHSGDTGGTNLEAGLKTVQDQLALRSTIDEYKNVVVITDGKPTYRIGGGNGSSGSKANNDAAAARADAIQETATIYTVCIAAEDDVCYSGSTQYVCSNCNKSRDAHVEVDLCGECGKGLEEHTKHQWFLGSYYTCPDGGYYDNETHYYCDETHATEYRGTSVEVGGVTVGDFLKNDIASSTSNAYNASSAEELENALAAIAAKIEESGSTGKDTSVVDPMGEFVIMGDINIEGVTDSAAGLTWELDPSKASKETVGDVTTYTYTITYPITLNTAAPGFKEFNEDGSVKYYPTNGYTYLSVPQADGSTKPIAFLVPGVCGEIPEYEWTVEYYLEDESSINLKAEDKTYSLDKTDEMGLADLHTSVKAPDDYEDKYDGYTFAKGDLSTVITKDVSKNVIRLYYNLKVAPVTVKHYYKTTTITPEGEEIVGEYEMDPAVHSEFAVIGKAYEAAEQKTFGGVQYDKVDDVKPGKRIHISATNENLIEFYYSRVDDQREPTTAQVDHVYTLSTYELNEDGKYELVEKAPVKEEKVQYSEDQLAGMVYPVGTEVKEGYEGYKLNTELGDYKALAENSMSFVIKPAAEDNVRTLYFEKTEDLRKEATVTVEHYYTKHITEIVGGKVVNYNDPDGVKVTKTFDVYVGERFEAVEVNKYEGETYNSDELNAGKLLIEEVKGGEVIKLYYDLSVAPKETSLIVNHYWVDRTEVTVDVTEQVEETVVDSEGNETIVTKDVVVGKDTVINWDIVDSKEGIEVSLYEGESYTAPKQAKEGYIYDAYPEYKASTDTGIGGTDRVLNLYYYHDAKADNRDRAEIEVHHNYVTKLTTIVGGEVAVVEVPDGTVTEKFPAEGQNMRSGDEFIAVAQPVYNVKTYTQTADVDLSVILQPGTNATIVINYEREDSDLDKAEYSVNYEYRTYTMTIKEGVADYWDAPSVTTDAVSGSGYVDQKVTLDAKAKADEGFAPLADNSSTVQILKKEGNTYTFIYEKYIPLDKGSVVVNHYYSKETIAINGTSTWTSSSVLGTAKDMYLGESYTAEPVPNGYDKMDAILDSAAFAPTDGEYVLTVSGNHVVDFHYKDVVDNSVKASYSVAHEYYLYDWDGSLISETKPAPVTGTGFATNLWVVAPEVTAGYELVSATYNGEKLEDYNIILQEGANVVVFRYEQTLARDYVNAKVIHNYYKDEAAMQAENAQPEKQYVENAENLPEGSEFSAEKRDAEGYVFHSAVPESMKIVVTENGENVIVVNYVRDTAKYQVIHIYNRNGVEEGRTSETLGGLDGDVVLADSIERVPVFEGRTYTFQSITGDITLDADEMQTITLVYNRKTSGGGGGGGGYTPPVVIPDEEPPLAELPDEEPPLAELPDEEPPLAELPEEEVPLALAPMTGDTTALYALSALGSAMGLMYLWLTGKKREEEI